MPKVLVDSDALSKVIDYMWESEKKHYEETVSSEGEDSPAAKKHIIHALKKLDKAMTTARAKPA